MHGGDLIGDVLETHGVRQLFALCGGHISPILVGAKARNIRVVDVRDEATAVFAADAAARITGIPGVAAVTAGPGCTNAITALKNAQMAESPVVLLGGATATVLRGRGALQDIDQLALLRACTKWAVSVERARDLGDVVAQALWRAKEGVPGPVFVECPLDLLYPEDVAREWYLKGTGKSLPEKAIALYLKRHLDQLFAGIKDTAPPAPAWPDVASPPQHRLRAAAKVLARAERPVIIVGSQALAEPRRAGDVARALETLGVPVYLSGMARGLLGRHHALQLRHRRREALREADVVLLAGTPADFRLDYGRHIGRKASLIAAGRDARALHKNRWPLVAAVGDAGAFLVGLARELDDGGATAARLARTAPWLAALRARDQERDEEIARDAARPGVGGVNPLGFCRALEDVMDDDATMVADGGDFVATASYVTRPRGPLGWLDPGVFGTLGVGAGFALGAGVLRPGREVWALFGDGSFGWSMAELDSFVRHGIPVIAVVGNDGGWAQIARDQITLLGDDVGTVLRRSDYHGVADALGGAGLVITRDDEVRDSLARAKALAHSGTPVVINVHLGKTDFRKGSISV